MIDSGYWAERHLPNEIQWLDDERVLFVGKKPGARREHKGLHVWTLGGDVVLYKLGARGLCLQGDTVSYIVRKNVGDVSGYFQGKYGDETRRDRQSYSDKLNCRTLSAYPGNEVDQVWKLLLDGHGYLDVGKLAPFNELPPVRHHSNDTVEPIAMPFNRRQIIREKTRFYPFKNAYLLYGPHDDEHQLVGRKDLSRTASQPVWWLHPDGNVEVIELGAGPWLRGGSVFMVGTHQGIVIVFHGGMISRREPGDQGAYLVQGGNIRRLLKGYITAPSVSPDGCKVALSHSPSVYDDQPGKLNKRTLKIIKFC